VSDPDTATASSEKHRISLSVRFVGLILVFVIVTGILLGLAASLVSVRNASEERRRGLEYAASVVAASLIPVIADQEPALIEAQLRGLMSATEEYGIECIEIEDATGVVIAQTAGGCTVGPDSGGLSFITTFTEPQLVRVPVVLEGLEVATVSIQFQREGLEQAVYEPLGVTALVLGVSMIVVGLWGGWVMLRMVVEPIGDLRDAALDIADGNREINVSGGRQDEIGDLASALEDMTAQLEAQEKQLLDSFSTLEGAYQEKDELARRLEYTMALKSNFVAVASHELGSPLAVIQLYSEMLEDNEFGDLDPQLAEAVGAIVSAVGRLGAIVSSLLDVALLERGHMTLEYSEVAYHDIVVQAVMDGEVLGADAGVTVVFEGEAPEVFLRGDAVRLRQAIDNLISNAIKYTGNEREVRISSHADGEWVSTCIADTGPGVSEERADVMFELFGRAETDDNAEVYGLGLGLPISDRIAKAHGGSVSFSPNEDGPGTTFCLKVPIQGAPEDAPAGFDAAGTGSLSTGSADEVLVEGFVQSDGESSSRTEG
jgi:signal transduction histidine kinase